MKNQIGSSYFCVFGKSKSELLKPPVRADPFRESEAVRPANNGFSYICVFKSISRIIANCKLQIANYDVALYSVC